MYLPTPTALSEKLISRLAAVNAWAPTASDCDKLAVAIMGDQPLGWLRRPPMRAIVAEHKFGADAAHLKAELAFLARDTLTLRQAGGADSLVLASAFFHLRFQNVHPLRDGNGRVGRLLLALQCQDASGMSLAEFVDTLHCRASEYQRCFDISITPEVQFSRLVHLLARLMRLDVGGIPVIPLAFSPVFPEKSGKPSLFMRR